MKLIRYHLPTIVKHVLVPKNDLGIPKITFGNWEDPHPPSLWEKFTKNPVFSFGECPLGGRIKVVCLHVHFQARTMIWLAFPRCLEGCLSMCPGKRLWRKTTWVSRLDHPQMWNLTMSETVSGAESFRSSCYCCNQEGPGWGFLSRTSN